MKNQYLHDINADSNFLINRLREGEESAYEMLFNEYYKVLTVFAKRYLNDLEKAKEVVQDLFVSIYEKREKLDINSSLKSYLFRSTHNRCINLINAQKVRDRYAEYATYANASSENNLEQEVNKTELEHALYKAIGDLPPRCRSIFKMNRFDGLSNGEIADKLNLSKRTVETQISKALKILRMKMEPYMTIFIMFFLVCAIRFIA
jgi:RNA polymerase sigma-70 factor, ECF subfamily